MNTRTKRLIWLSALGATAVTTAVIAALGWTPSDEPYGYIAPVALTSANITTGTELGFAPHFESTTWGGDVIARSISAQGVLGATPVWEASKVLPAPASRYIFTTNGAGTPVPFRTTPAPAGLTATQLATFWSAGVVDYLRGVRAAEGSTYRTRDRLIGDIIHSNPVYVGKARAGYTFDGYPTFAIANKTRPGRVYIGSNDGMVHAFDASTGVETFAFMPTQLVATVDETARPSYTHRYYVDGPLSADDAYINKSGMQWRTILVGGLGAGGKGLFALDVTSAAPITSEGNGAGGAGSHYLWEVTDASAGMANLGYAYARPTVARMNDGRWAVVVGNGHLSTSGVASLFVLDAATGAVIREIPVNATYGGLANGLSSPALVDLDGDSKVDYAYAGDLNGNLWKFDLSGTSSASWGLAFGGKPLFRTDLPATGVRPPITSAPEVGRHPDRGVFVYVGTGRLFAIADAADLSTNYVYGIWDDPNRSSSALPIASSSLQPQTLYGATHDNGTNVYVTTNYQPNWSTVNGWYVPLLVDGATIEDEGERVLQDPVLRDGRVQLMVHNPTVPKGENWFLQLDAITGGAPSRTVLDINGDLALTTDDNVDRLGGTVTDVPEDRAVAIYAGFGLASRPTVASAGVGDTAVLNTLYIVDPVPPPPVDPEDPGILGGHIDLDTSSIIYAFNKGTTDQHVHQWDDITGLTEINFGADGSAMLGAAGYHEIKQNITGSKKFFIVIGNAPFSWDGVLSINGTAIRVVDYDKMERDHFKNGAAATKKLTVYSFNPSGPDLAAGVVKMTDLRLTFSPYSILRGGVMPTVTGCVRGNTPGANMEYRNGALIVQAIDATSFSGSFTYDSVNKIYSAGGLTSVKSDVGPGKHVVYTTKGLLWEASTFYHWKGACYGAAGYKTTYQSITGVTFDSLLDSAGEATRGSVSTASDDDNLGAAVEGIAQQTVIAQRQAGTTLTGRLFWHEVVLDK